MIKFKLLIKKISEQLDIKLKNFSLVHHRKTEISKLKKNNQYFSSDSHRQNIEIFLKISLIVLW